MAERTLRADAQRNLQLILDAAGEAFAEGGLEVGVADIAKRAGVGTATIFRRFPTKEDLILAVMLDRLGELLAEARAAAAIEPGGLEVLRAFFERAVDFQVCDRGLLDGAAKQMFATDERLVAMRTEFIELFGRMLHNAQAAGEVRDDIAAEDIPILLHGVAHAATLTEPVVEGLWRRYLDLTLDALRPGAATPLRTPPPTYEQLDATAGGVDC